MGRFLFWGFWERARPLTRNHRRSDSIALTEGLLIAAWQLCPAGLALSVTFGATSPIGRGTGVPVRPTRDEQSLHCPETVVPCYRDSRQLDKVLLSRSRCPRKRGPPFCVLSGLRRPAESGPARQWLPLWGSWRVAPERARPLTRNRRHSDSIALTKGLHPDEFPLIMYNFFEM